MKKLVLIIVCGFLLGGCTIRNPFLKKPAGLEVASTPPADIFLNGEQAGTTPLSRTDLPPGEYQLKLVPQGDSTLNPWESQLSLKPEVTTIVNKTFAPAETDSSSYILELQPAPGATYLSVISDPATVNLDLDQEPKGYTPVTKLVTTPGAHQLELTSPGYHSLALGVNAVKDYNLLVIVKLAADTIVLTSPSPVASGSAQTDPGLAEGLSGPHVTIEETGTGWLRVRAEPSSSGEELGKADVGESLKYLGETSDTGWHQVEFEGQTGWVSAKYAKLTE